MKRKGLARRDLVGMVGRRAGKLNLTQSSYAWQILSGRLEGLEQKDIPKFLDLLVSIRVATILARRIPSI